MLLIWTWMLLVVCVYGGLPVTFPGQPTTLHQPKYNMIDAYPGCYERGLCPPFYPGGQLSAFPNGEEKYQMVMHNMFRMFANSTLSIPHAKYKFGGNDAKNTSLCPSWDVVPFPKPNLDKATRDQLYPCTSCGTWSEYREPLYWYSDANQAARFKQWDENSCDQSWYDEAGNTAHHTCKWVLPEYHTINGVSRPEFANHCLLFGGADDCGFDSRVSDFCHEDSCWFETEGICGMNTCVTDPHCEPIYGTAYKFEGAGFIEGMNGAATQYVQLTDNDHQILYPLPSAAHFDERYKLSERDWNAEDNFFSLILYYFDDFQAETAGTCYALYDGAYHEMNVLVSSFEFGGDAFSSNSYNAMFTTNHAPPTQCEPYSFLCRTSSNRFVRLPEDESYFFGTDWTDWEYTNYSSKGYGRYPCKEQHYYLDAALDEWVVNGDPNLAKEDIWYYSDANYGECQGCSKIASLVCLEQFLRCGSESCNCDPTNEPTKDPTSATNEPTNNPTTTATDSTSSSGTSTTTDSNAQGNDDNNDQGNDDSNNGGGGDAATQGEAGAKKALSTGAVVGITFGVLIPVSLLVIGVVFLLRSKRMASKPFPDGTGVKTGSYMSDHVSMGKLSVTQQHVPNTSGLPPIGEDQVAAPAAATSSASAMPDSNSDGEDSPSPKPISFALPKLDTNAEEVVKHQPTWTPGSGRKTPKDEVTTPLATADSMLGYDI